MLGTSGASCAVVLPYLYVLCGHQGTEGHVAVVRRLHLSRFEWETVEVEGTAISPRDKFSTWVYENRSGSAVLGVRLTQSARVLGSLAVAGQGLLSEG